MRRVSTGLALAMFALSCGPPAGDPVTAVETRTVEQASPALEPLPFPPKPARPFGPGYYPKPLGAGDGS